MSTTKMTTIAVVCLALGLESCCCPPPQREERGDQSPVTSVERTDRPKKATEPAKPEIPTVEYMLTAKTLFREYNANEVRADSKYKGKRLAVAGRIESIDKDFMGNMVLKLASGDRFYSVSATLLDSEKSKAMDLSKGEAVHLLCTGGTMVIKSPTLRKCVMVPENTDVVVRNK